jgi:hypothetical protein
MGPNDAQRIEADLAKIMAMVCMRNSRLEDLQPSQTPVISSLGVSIKAGQLHDDIPVALSRLQRQGNHADQRSARGFPEAPRFSLTPCDPIRYFLA